MPINANLVIRGGTVIDGTGAPAFIADVAIDGEQICAVGLDLEIAGAPDEIDAKGLLITPGWIDVHTHYDAQATWDPLLTPSAHCGVTTVIMGNCGVGFAPCQKELRPFLLDLMEAVEDIPGTALVEGIQWEWETFPEYLDALARREYACDLAVMIGHGGVRTWVLGKRANISDKPGGPEKDPVTNEEIRKMAEVVREAVSAGAFGFSTSRLLLHRDNRGVLTPGALAARAELLQICDAIVEGGGGMFQMSNDFSTYEDVPYSKMDPAKKKAHQQSELDWMAQAMRKHKDRFKVTFGLGSADGASSFSKWANQNSSTPAQCMVQVQTRQQAFHMSHASGKNMFSISAPYRQARAEAKGDQTKLMDILRSPVVRAAILKDMSRFRASGNQSLMFAQYINDDGKKVPSWMLTGDSVYPWAISYDPPEDTMIPNIASREGKSILDACYDLLLDIDGSHGGILWHPLFKHKDYCDRIVASLEYDNIIPGFDDAGAHCTLLTDATSNTTNLAYLGRDRKFSKLISLERIVKLQTGDAAAMFFLEDRGILQPGKRADLNIIDFEKLNVKRPFWAKDLPTNAGRWLQYAEGYHSTILRGVVTFKNGEHCGAFPGRLVRNPLRVGVIDNHGVQAASIADEKGNDVDLAKYAVEISREGGASAFARVLRDQDKGLSVEGSRSKL